MSFVCHACKMDGETRHRLVNDYYYCAHDRSLLKISACVKEMVSPTILPHIRYLNIVARRMHVYVCMRMHERVCAWHVPPCTDGSGSIKKACRLAPACTCSAYIFVCVLLSDVCIATRQI